VGEQEYPYKSSTKQVINQLKKMVIITIKKKKLEKLAGDTNACGAEDS
jgi:hypothetical protein